MAKKCSRHSAAQILAIAAVLMVLGAATHGGTDPKSDPDLEKMLVENVYSKFKGTTGFLVGCQLSGSAGELGFDQQRMRDRMKLRLANTIANVPIIKDNNNDGALYMKPIMIIINIWTVGSDFPVAYHVEITAGNFLGDSRIFTTAVLGYGNSKNVPDSVNDVVDDLIDDLAVAFHKGVGDF